MTEQKTNQSEISELSNYQAFLILVVIPFVQAMITGLLIGCSIGVLAWATGLANATNFGMILISLALIIAFAAWFTGRDAAANTALSVAALASMLAFAPLFVRDSWQIKAGVAAWVLSTTVAWLPMLSRSRYMLESWLGIDLNFDGIIGDPEQELPHDLQDMAPMVVRAEVKNGSAWLIANIKTDPGKLRQLAKAVINGQKTLAHSNFVGAGQLYSRQEWGDLIDQLEARRLIRQRNENARHLGFDLTAEGAALLKKIARGEDLVPFPRATTADLRDT